MPKPAPMNARTARRCVNAIAEYLQRRDESPRACADLKAAVAALEKAAADKAMATLRDGSWRTR